MAHKNGIFPSELDDKKPREIYHFCASSNSDCMLQNQIPLNALFLCHRQLLHRLLYHARGTTALLWNHPLPTPGRNT
jgi:hypothetical protein